MAKIKVTKEEEQPIINEEEKVRQLKLPDEQHEA